MKNYLFGYNFSAKHRSIRVTNQKVKSQNNVNYYCKIFKYYKPIESYNVIYAYFSLRI